MKVSECYVANWEDNRMPASGNTRGCAPKDAKDGDDINGTDPFNKPPKGW